MTLTFKRQHSVDNMFENAWTSKATFFCDMTNNHNADIASFGFLHKTVRTSAYLNN
jgi:hypothetical protein